MTAYQLSLFVHLCALLAAVSASALGHFAERRLLAARSLADAAQWATLIAKASPVFPVALVTLVASGSYMVHRAWSFGDGWIVASLAGSALLFVAGGAIGGGRHRRLMRTLAAPDSELSAVLALARDPVARVNSWADTGLAIGIVFVMTTKPSLAGSIAGLAVGAVVGAVIGAALLKRNPANFDPAPEPIEAREPPNRKDRRKP